MTIACGVFFAGWIFVAWVMFWFNREPKTRLAYMVVFSDGFLSADGARRLCDAQVGEMN